MLRCLVIGGGMQFRQCVSFLKLRESVGEIKIVGIIDDTAYADTLFDWPFMSYLNVSNLAINCCLIATDNGHIHIVEKLHIPDDVIVPWRALFIPGFTFGKYLSLKKSHVSIIASNCWGGVTYSYLGLRFLSPFINMWIENDIEIYANLKDVINNHLEFVKEEYNPVDKISYPVYTLGGGKCLHMNHYPNFTQAVDKWNERKQRINWNNLFLMTLTDDKKVAEKFDSLPYTKKVIFTSFPSDIPSAMYLDVYNSPRYTGRQFWEAVVELAWGTITYYDIWDLLLYGFDQKSHNCIIR